MTKPNILWVFPDQWRGDWIEAVSHIGLSTPNIDRLIERGKCFGRAWTPSPLCAPARACIAFGVEYDDSPVQNNRQSAPLGVPTLYSVLRDAGYQVASCGKSDLLKGNFSWGADGRHIDNKIDQMLQLGIEFGRDSAGKHATLKAAQRGGSDPYTNFLKGRGLLETYCEDFSQRKLYSHADVPLAHWLNGTWSTPPDSYTNAKPSPLPEDAYHDNFIGRLALDVIDQFDKTLPWFLVVNFPGPHEPLDVTEAMAARWQSLQLPEPVDCHFADKEKLKLMRRHYAAMLENIDGWVGRFVERLESDGTIDNTLIVFASDHGDMLGDRNLWQKEVPFEPSLHVPMILSGADIATDGQIVEAPASLMDLPRTLLDFAGVQIPDGFAGHSLKSYLEGVGVYPRTISYSGLGSWRAYSNGRYKLIVGLDTDVAQKDIQFGKFEPAKQKMCLLFDLLNDPKEKENLFQSLPMETTENLISTLIMKE